VGCGQKPAGTGPVFKIGADFTLTGNTAFWSEKLKNGMDLAVEEVNANASSGKGKVVVIYEDNQGNPGKAVSIWQKLDTVDGVSVVVTCFTPTGQPLRDSAERSKLPLVATVTSAKAFAAINPWTFRDFPPQEQQCPAIARYAFKTLKMKTAGYLVVNDDYGLDGAKIFRQEFESLGGKVLGGDTFEQKDTDMRGQVEKVIRQVPDCLLIVGRDQSLAMTIKQTRELGYKGVVLGNNGFDADIVWKMVGNAGDGVVFASAYTDFETDSGAKAFKDKYVQRYNQQPDYTDVYGYTIGKYLAGILLETGGDRAKVREALSSLNVDSIRGKLSMNSSRDVVSPIGMYILEGGKRRFLQKMD
jgi:branched-chain amino acid transport system substrate-binding protein